MIEHKAENQPLDYIKARLDIFTGPQSSLVQPHFVVCGEGVSEAIESMPGIFRQSVDVLCQTIAEDMALGIKSHMLFAVVDSHDKDPTASKASFGHIYRCSC